MGIAYRALAMWVKFVVIMVNVMMHLGLRVQVNTDVCQMKDVLWSSAGERYIFYISFTNILCM